MRPSLTTPRSTGRPSRAWEGINEADERLSINGIPSLWATHCDGRWCPLGCPRLKGKVDKCNDMASPASARF